MTKEESIAILDGFKHNPLFNGQHFEALDMAISALSAEGNLISRQAVEEINSEIPKIHELFDIAYEYNKEDSTRTELSQKCTTYLLDMWQTLGAIVDNYPSVENKGEWIESKERSGHWYCSVCGGIHTDPETGKWREIFDYKYPFCPNCGADMRGEHDFEN